MRPFVRLAIVPSVLALGLLGGPGVATAAEPAAPATYTSVEVPGADYTDVTGINNWGTVVGYYGDASGEHGFIRSDGRFTTVDAPGTDHTRLTSVNDLGTVTGSYLTDFGGRTHGFLRDVSGHFTWLDAPEATGPDPSGTVATGVNDLGTVVGYYFSSAEGTTVFHGFVWSWGRFRTYDAPAPAAPGPSYTGTQLFGVSNLGVMVGRTSYLEEGVPPDQAIRVAPSGFSAYADPAVPANFCGYTHFTATNVWGTVAGNSGNGCTNPSHPTPTHNAWLLTGTEFTSLAYPGAAKTVAGGINDWGTVVGTWTDSSEREHGFVLRTR